MKRILSWSVILCLSIMACGTPAKELRTPTQSLKHYTFSELDSLTKQEQRPIAIFLHAPWCKFCRNMEQTSLQNKEVINLLNEKYYFISFDGEQKEAINFQNHHFKYQPSGRTNGTHELATALGQVNGELAYPTFVLLNPGYEIVFQYNAFMNSETLARLLEEGIKGY